MKKDLTQPFERGLSRIQIIIQDRVSHTFFIQPEDPVSPDSDDWYWLPQFDFDESKGQSALGMKLVEVLRELGFATSVIRELDRQTTTSYSYMDDTPGTIFDMVCLHVLAEATEKEWKGKSKKPGLLVSLADFEKKSQSAPISSPVVRRGVLKLLQEEVQNDPDRI